MFSILRITETENYKKNKYRWDKIFQNWEIESAYELDTDYTKAISIKHKPPCITKDIVVNYDIKLFLNFEKAHDFILKNIENYIKE